MLKQNSLHIIFLFIIPLFSMAQDISFFHLSKKEGLSDNQVTGVVMDKNGLLWVGTSEGLNCYDGYTVKRFYKEEYAALENSNILRMTCDEKNRLWIHFADKSVAMLDEDRKFHAISITENGKRVTADFLLPYTSRGILFLSGSRLYHPNEKNPLIINRLQWADDTSLNNNFVRINIWDKDKLICSGNNRIALFDVTNLKMLHSFTVPGILAAARLSDTEALVTMYNTDKLCKVNLISKKIVQRYSHLKDQYGEEMMMYPRSIYHLREQQFIFTSAYAGVYIFDAAKERLLRYQHDPTDPQSISANNTNYLFSDTSGYFFITSHTAGLNYFNVNHYLAKWKPSFRDEQSGKIFDGYINCISQDSDGDMWLGTQNCLVEWNRKNNTARFQQYGQINGQPLEGTEEVRAICFDKKGKMWIGLNRFGVVVLDQKKRVLKYLNANETGNSLCSDLIYDIKEAPDGKIWMATSAGLNIVDAVNFRVMNTNAKIYLQKLSNVVCRFIWFNNEKEAWLGTTEGAYRISLNEDNWQRFNEENGLKNSDVLCVTGDNFNNIYIGTPNGLHVIKDGKVVAFYDHSNGLRSNACEGLMRDNQGKIWIGNNNSLICYEPAIKRFIPFDESAGLSDAGFRPFSFYKTIDGETFWGSDKGVNYFYPDKLRKLNLPLKVVVNNVTTPDTSYWLATSKHVNLSYSKNAIGFSFSAIDLYSSRNILYQYKLEGIDDDWKIVLTPQEVQYSKLPPGDYTFKVVASKDGSQWVEANNTISLTVITPWWRNTWFITSAVILLFAAAGYYTNQRSKKIARQQEQIETEQAINYFASSMNEQTTTEEILWNVAKNCIGRLHFEDCVIYLKDTHRPVLIQKAAWGPKTKDDNKIVNPIEIPIGQGIVGSVGRTGHAEIIGDTSRDKRYIVDDNRRNAEISVPIIYNGKILGIIDSEHSKKNFFTQKHLSILTTIASLCANKLVRLHAETEKQHALMELLNHKRKTAEAQLKSLRLQMNPHFLFNSLNAIQQIILAGDEKGATLYLSKFSRMLRLVLAHSDKEKVTLKEELEMLRLYVELESLRFRDSFHYEITCSETVDADEIKIPTLLIQPFVENAIWHGLLHKEGSRSLCIKLTEDSAENILCIIEDNGIGREASKKINQQHSHISKGIAVAEDRLATYNSQHLLKSKVVTEDLKDINGDATGTKVTMTLPLLN